MKGGFHEDLLAGYMSNPREKYPNVVTVSFSAIGSSHLPIIYIFNIARD